MIQMKIREIKASDNQQIAEVIRKVLLEFDVPKTGTAYADPELDHMFETYQTTQAAYWVIHKGDQILGGAGIAPLQEGDPSVCELQKMYFDAQARGLGHGAAMMDICLDYARNQEFSQVYLETLPQMVEAQRLYQKYGFKSIPNALGHTGHNNCSVWMIKPL
ncbi:MAG: GNAT family N-acetyltransferase [Flavobacteriaceae bacterium]